MVLDLGELAVALLFIISVWLRVASGSEILVDVGGSILSSILGRKELALCFNNCF